MELLQLRYFCDAAETEKFSETAKNFLVPVSSISQTIKRLEAELGAELFEHKGNRVVLNGKGKQFYEYATKALSLLDSGKTFMSDDSKTLAGDIHIVCMTNYGIVTRVVENFLKKYPDVNFIIDLEFNSDFDILISDTFPEQYSKKILLVDDAVCVAMNKTHRLAFKDDISITDLENERFITLTGQSSMKTILLNACRKAGFSPNLAIQTYDTTYLRRYIVMGLGIAFAPASWSKRHSENIEFKEIENLRRKTYAFLSKENYTRRVVKEFFSELERAVDTIDFNQY